MAKRGAIDDLFVIAPFGSNRRSGSHRFAAITGYPSRAQKLTGNVDQIGALKVYLPHLASDLDADSVLDLFATGPFWCMVYSVIDSLCV